MLSKASLLRSTAVNRIVRNSLVRLYSSNTKPEVIASVTYDKTEQPGAPVNKKPEENNSNDDEVPPKRPPYVLGVLGAGLILFGGYYFYENKKAVEHAEKHRRLTHEVETPKPRAIYVPPPHIPPKVEEEPKLERSIIDVVTSQEPVLEEQQNEATTELIEQVTEKDEVQPEIVSQPDEDTQRKEEEEERQRAIDLELQAAKEKEELQIQEARRQKQLELEEEERLSNERLEKEKSEREELQKQEERLKQLTGASEVNEQQQEYIDSLRGRVERLERDLNNREDELRRVRELSREREVELTTETEKQIQQTKEQYLQKEQELIESTRKSIEEAKDELDTLIALERLENARLTERLVREQEHKLTLKYNEAALERIERLASMTYKVYSVEYAFNSNARYLNDSVSLQKLSLALYSLQYALRTNGPFKPEIEVLKQVAQNDELVDAIVKSIPDELTKKGVPLLEDLQDRFSNSVKRRAIAASYAPQHGGLIGYLYSQLASAFIIEEKGLVEGDHANARLARAEFYLKKRRLAECVDELEQASAQSEDVAFILRDWIQEAKARLVTDLALEAIQAHMINLTSTVNQ
jgi:myosin heavy subunit